MMTTDEGVVVRASWGNAAALALGCGLLAGCGGGGADSPGEGADRPTAAQAVRAGITGLRDAGTATFTTHVDLSGLTVDQDGAFTIPGQAQRSTYTISTGATMVEVRMLGVDAQVFVSYPDVDRTPTACFMTGDPERIAAISGADVAGLDAGLPTAAFVAASATGGDYTSTSPDASTVTGSVDLAQALSLVGAKLVDRLGLKAGAHRVAATLTLRDGVLTGFTVAGPDLNKAAAKAGIPGGSTLFAPDSVVEGAFDDLGSEVAVSAPPASRLVPLDAGDAALGSAARRCRAG